MLGEKIGEGAGQVTSQRVLPSEGGGPRIETSFQAKGTLLGIEETERGTYIAEARPDGTVFGGGQGVIMGKGGQMATWVGHGVGKLKKDGSVSYRGCVFYQSSSPKWSRLNSVAAIFEFEVDAQGRSSAKLWEWK
jgi:hypothetical protein